MICKSNKGFFLCHYSCLQAEVPRPQMLGSKYSINNDFRYSKYLGYRVQYQAPNSLKLLSVVVACEEAGSMNGSNNRTPFVNLRRTYNVLIKMPSQTQNIVTIKMLTVFQMGQYWVFFLSFVFFFQSIIFRPIITLSPRSFSSSSPSYLL